MAVPELCVRAITARVKKTLIPLGVLLAAAVIGVRGLLALPDPITHSVTVAFLGYTNMDTRGFNDQYTWAWFRIENKSSVMLACRQGPIFIERAGSWIQDTNTLGRQYDPIMEPGQALTVSMIPPSDATRWRSSFLLTRMGTQSSRCWSARFGLRRFIDAFPFSKLGTQGQTLLKSNPQSHVVTSETLKL